ncbi:MAG TPA: methionyl-tRNA formyltransferase, partial [Rectinemataceae bacterium]
EARAAAAALAPDILVSFAYGRIFGPKFLSLFPLGGLNVHPSLLPRHRGSSPIQHAILERDAETGICVQALALEMDCGDIFACERIGLSGRESASSLSAWAAERGALLIERVLEDMEAGRARGVPQVGEPSYCGKIGKEDGLLDWSRSAEELDARIRAFDLWPLAYGYLGGTRLNILEAEPSPARAALPRALPGTILGIDPAKGILVQTGDGELALRRLQLAGRKALSFREFANGARNLTGSVIENRGPRLEN